MRRFRLLAPFVIVLALAVGPASTAAQEPRPPAAQDEFVPVSELPDQEQLPAAPLLITAYAVFWIASFAYLVFIRRRMTAVDRELADLRRRVETTGASGRA